jgi:hypothetical protein
MLKLPTVILHHTTIAGSHYDWLWLDPQNDEQLLGIRVPHPPNHWHLYPSFTAQPLKPHRLAYLTYQGKISKGRGSVVQVARGYVQGNRIGKVGWDWRVQLHGASPAQSGLRLQLKPISPRFWRCDLVKPFE